MSEDRNSNHGPELLIGGLICVVVLVSMAAKAVQSLFVQLSSTFDAFTVLMGSFGLMAFQVFKIVACLALAVAAVYFTYKYVKMVKRATELQEYIDNQLTGNLMMFRESVNEQLETSLRLHRDILDSAHKRIDKLMEPPTPSTTVSTALTNVDPGAPVQSATESSESQEGTASPEPVALSHPY